MKEKIKRTDLSRLLKSNDPEQLLEQYSEQMEPDCELFLRTILKDLARLDLDEFLTSPSVIDMPPPKPLFEMVEVPLWKRKSLRNWHVILTAASFFGISLIWPIQWQIDNNKNGEVVLTPTPDGFRSGDNDHLLFDYRDAYRLLIIELTNGKTEDSKLAFKNLISMYTDRGDLFLTRNVETARELYQEALDLLAQSDLLSDDNTLSMRMNILESLVMTSEELGDEKSALEFQKRLNDMKK